MQGSSDIYPPVHFFNPIKKRMLRWTYGRTDLLHSWGIEMQTNAIRLGATPEKILTMPRGINTNTFSIGKQALKSDHFVWLVSRQLNTEYNHNLIIRSFASLAKKIDVRIKLIIAGDGPLRNQLQDLAHELQLDSCIRFTGKVSNTELADLYVTADFYISLTDSEGVSASLLEAMASGCIPVVTKLPSNCEWVSNSNGVLVGELSIDEVEKAMKNAIENYLDLYELRYQNRLLVEQKADQKANAMFFVKKYRELIAQKLNTSPHPSE
jgi:glycosyltransferase involved in cell wall biosynthesis